jgi:amino acid transporter
LSEEVKNPKRNMLLAPALVCLFTGIISCVQIYLAQQVWPDYTSFTNSETAFFDVSSKVGGTVLFNAIALVLGVACLGSGLAGQAGASRLLYAMGRDGVLPKKIFSHINKKTSIPDFNILIISVLTLVISFIISYQGAAELLNFGAFLGFMGVNAATFRQFYFLRPITEKRSILMDAALPLSGFIVCLSIWISLPLPAKIIGGIWLFAGTIYLYFSTHGFRKQPAHLDFRDL